MKKSAIFSLLAIFLFNSVGYYIVFKISQSEIRKEVKTFIQLGIPEAQLTTIEISKAKFASINWEKKNKEFFYQGKLFDIVKKKELQNSIIFYCIDDKKEIELFADLDEHIDMFVASQNSKSNSSSKKLTNHVVKIYFSNFYSFRFHNPSTLFCFFQPTKNYLSEFSETKSPPPEFV